MKDKRLLIFKDFKIRREYNAVLDKWYFSVIDIVALLTEQTDYKKAKTYWTTLKSRLKDEGSEVVTNCDRLKMLARDGKRRQTDVANIETILRLIQSIPSKKTEPVKIWLAKVGYERMQEISDPEKSLDRARENWQKLGRSEKWIQQRMTGQGSRNKLTDYWKGHDVKKGKEYAILTNIIHSEWTGLSVEEHKSLKELKKQNLRDHMTEAELIFTALAELSTKQIAESVQAEGLNENKVSAKSGGDVAKNARKDLESKTKQSIITKDNFLIDKKELE